MLKVFPIPEALSELSSVTFDITFRMLSPLPLGVIDMFVPGIRISPQPGVLRLGCPEARRKWS